MRKLLITVAAAIFAPVLFGTTLYVSTTGSDDATGESVDSPLRTINKALETLAIGGGGRSPARTRYLYGDTVRH